MQMLTTLELSPGSSIQAKYTLASDRRTAEVLIEGLGYVLVDGEECVLHPIMPICSARIVKAIAEETRSSLLLLDAVETLAKKLFPDHEEMWIWSLHDVSHLGCEHCSN